MELSRKVRVNNKLFLEPRDDIAALSPNQLKRTRKDDALWRTRKRFVDENDLNRFEIGEDRWLLKLKTMP